MNGHFRKRQETGRLKISALWLLLLALLGSGCQTFSLTEEQFAQQQQGQVADPETGAVVGAAGTLGYFGAMIGALVAGWK
jgi:hypothetical protein